MSDNLAANKTAAQRYRERRKEAGLCATDGCTNKRREDGALCQDCLDWWKEAGVKYREQVRKETFIAYGGPCCFGCGETEDCCLTLDHIEQDGAIQRKITKQGSGSMFYRWLKARNFPPGFRVLCFNCQIRAFRGIKFPLDRRR